MSPSAFEDTSVGTRHATGKCRLEPALLQARPGGFSQECATLLAWGALGSILHPVCLSSHNTDLDVVNRRQRIEEAIPLFTTLPPDPKLASRRPEVERGSLEAVDVHRVAQNREIALLLGQPARKPSPGLAAIFAAPHRRRAPRATARRRLKRHNIYRLRVVGMDQDGKSEV